MKYIIFILLFILWPQQGYTKAICRAGITQAECCATDPSGANLTLSDCQSSCSGTCSGTSAYFVGCYA